MCITNWGKLVLQIRAALFCYKLGQLYFVTNQVKCCYKLGQLHCYKLWQVLFQIGAAITNQGNRYYKIGQLLQIGAGIKNQGSYDKLGHNRAQLQNQNHKVQSNIYVFFEFQAADHQTSTKTLDLHANSLKQLFLQLHL